jgi:hypothetical protein
VADDSDGTVAGKRPRSHWGDDERVEVGRERRLAPPRGVPVEDFESEDLTGQIEAGPELEAARARRPTPQRLSLLERKHDSLHKTLHETREEVADIRGDQKAQGVLLSELHDDMKARREDQADAKKHTRERITKAIGGVFALLTSGAVIHYIAGKL